MNDNGNGAAAKTITVESAADLLALTKDHFDGSTPEKTLVQCVVVGITADGRMHKSQVGLDILQEKGLLMAANELVTRQTYTEGGVA